MEGAKERLGGGGVETLQMQTPPVKAIVHYVFYITYDRAEEADHSVLWSALTWGGGGFLRGWREGSSERSLGRGRGRNNSPYVLMLLA